MLNMKFGQSVIGLISELDEPTVLVCCKIGYSGVTAGVRWYAVIWGNDDEYSDYLPASRIFLPS